MPDPARNSFNLRQILRWGALIVLTATIGFWALKGAHRGWSQNQVPVKQTDAVTGIEFVTYEKRYVPGVDFLLIGGTASAGFHVLSFFFNRNPTTSRS